MRKGERKMKINIMSDLHFEFGGLFEPPKSDVLILAGDIGLATKPNSIVPFIEEASERIKYIIMIMGNHEHYNGDFEKSYGRIAKMTSYIPNFTLLENNCKIIDDVAFIGSSFWSDIDPAREFIISRMMNDYQVIDKGDRQLNVNDTRSAHYRSREIVFDAIDIYKNAGFKTVVITHHNPTLRTAEEYRGNIYNSAYGTNYEELIEIHKPNYWIYGHTHKSAQYQVGETKLICNPRGYYPSELNEEFDPNLIIEV